MATHIDNWSHGMSQAAESAGSCIVRMHGEFPLAVPYGCLSWRFDFDDEIGPDVSAAQVRLAENEFVLVGNDGCIASVLGALTAGSSAPTSALSGYPVKSAAVCRLLKMPWKRKPWPTPTARELRALKTILGANHTTLQA